MISMIKSDFPTTKELQEVSRPRLRSCETCDKLDQYCRVKYLWPFGYSEEDWGTHIKNFYCSEWEEKKAWEE